VRRRRAPAEQARLGQQKCTTTHRADPAGTGRDARQLTDESLVLQRREHRQCARDDQGVDVAPVHVGQPGVGSNPQPGGRAHRASGRRCDGAGVAIVAGVDVGEVEEGAVHPAVKLTRRQRKHLGCGVEDVSRTGDVEKLHACECDEHDVLAHQDQVSPRPPDVTMTRCPRFQTYGFFVIR
jgi:hypothetical protein